MNLINILAYNPQLFDGIILPAALSQEDVVNEILQECATMEPLYGDPDLFHQMILHWFSTRNYTFQKLYDTMHLDYNPLENAYRTEQRETQNTRDYTRNASYTGSGSEDTESSGTSDSSKDTENTASTDSTRDNNSDQNTESKTEANSKDQVAPYNDNNFHDTTQTTGTNTATGSVQNDSSETFSETQENSGNETVSENFKNSGSRNTKSDNSESVQDTETNNTTDSFTLKGSIGLITPQQMIEQERDVVKFNLYEYIAMEFSKRFMIQIY